MHTVRMKKADRLRTARQRIFPTASAAARAMGVTVSTYISHENDTRDFDDDDARLYARRLKVPLPWLVLGVGEPPDDLSSEDVAALMHNAEEGEGLPFAGEVDAGSFRPVDQLDQTRDTRTVPLPRVHKYEKERQYAFKVRGDSMNAAHIEEGMWLTVIDYDDYLRRHGSVRAGTLVVVERTRSQGSEREYTVKEVQFYRDRTEFVPRSTNPVHKPIVVPFNETPDSDEQVRIVAVVAQASWLYL